MRILNLSFLSKVLSLATISLLLVCASWAGDSEKILHTFAAGNTDGNSPYAGVTLDNNGNLYGSTAGGGTSYGGTVFELTPQPKGGWDEQILYSFTGLTDGSAPFSTLVFDSKGNLYGTTVSGNLSFGTVFELSPGPNGIWSEKTLYAFTGGADGATPYGGLTFDEAGNLYGITTYGAKGFGTAFELVAGADGAWTQKTLYTFTGDNDGGYPFGSLTLDSKGNLYGIGTLGGSHDYGFVFELSPKSSGPWKEKVIFSFAGGAGGIAPNAGGVVFDSAGNLYAETYSSIFELTPSSSGTWTSVDIHDFIGGSDGALAQGPLTIDGSGNLYGMTFGGGKHRGTVFELSPGKAGLWKEKILHSFSGTSDGEFPIFNSVAVDGSGNVYGTTLEGGASTGGVVFEVTP